MTDDWAIAPATTVREFEVDECLTLYRSADRVLVLNATASDVWRLCDGEHRVAEVVELLARAYSVRPAEIEDGIRATIERFLEEGFLERGRADDR